MTNAQVGIQFVVNNDDLRGALAQLMELFETLGIKASDSFARAAASSEQSATRTLAATKEAATQSVDVVARANELRAEADKKYVALKEEYEKKGVDSVRAMIHSLEQDKRVIAQAATETQEKEVLKQLAVQKKALDTQLQQFRSVEKELTGGRTFTEIMEKQTTDVKKGILTMIGEYRKLQSEQAEVEKKMEAAASAEAKQELAVRHEAIQKEISEKKAELKEQAAGVKEGAASGLGLQNVAGGLLAGGGIAAAGAGFEKLIEAGKEFAEIQEQLNVGWKATGASEQEITELNKQNTASVKELASKYAVNSAELNKATATYLKLGGTTDDLKGKQEMIIGLANRAGIDFEQAAKMLAKSTDEEVQGQLTKVGIKFDKNASSAERYKQIQQELKGTMDGLAESANSPLGQFAKFKNTLEDLTMKIGGPLFQILTPLLNILGELASSVGDMLIPIFDDLQPVFEANVDILNAFMMPVLKFIIGLVKQALDFIHPLLDGLKTIAEGVKSAANSVLSFLGITTDEQKKKVAEQGQMAEDANASQKRAYKKAEADLDDHHKQLRGQIDEQANNHEISEQDHRKKMLQTDIDYWKQKVANAQQYGQEDADAQKQLHASEVKLQEEEKKERDEASKQAREAHKKQFDEKKSEIAGENEMALALIRQRAADGLITEQEAKKEELAQKLKFTADEHAVDAQFITGKSERALALAKLDADAAETRKQMHDNDAKLAQDLLAKQEEVAKKKIELMKPGVEKELAIESEKYKEEQAKYKDNAAMLALLEEEHQGAVQKIKDVAAQKAQEKVRTAELDIQKIRTDIAKSELETEKTLGLSKDAVIEREKAFALEAQRQQYEEEKDKETKRYKEALDAAQGNAALIVQIEQQHHILEQLNEQKNQDTLNTIALKAVNERRQQEIDSLKPVADAFSGTNAKIQQGFFSQIDTAFHAQDNLAGQVASNIIKNFVQIGEKKVADLALSLASNAVLGGATAATAAGITTAMTPAATMTSIATFGGAAAAGETSVLGALAATKAATLFAEGGIVTKPTLGIVREAGENEAVIPLSRFGEVASQYRNAGGDDALVGEIRALHETIRNQPPVAVVDQDRFNLSATMAQQLRSRRQL